MTDEHPIFVVGEGWTNADQIRESDLLRDAQLRQLLVVSVEPEKTVQLVHNLEIAEAHTYFVGDFEVWGHNASRTPTKGTKLTVLERDGCKCRYCGVDVVMGAGSPNSLEYDHYIPHAEGGGREDDNIVCSCRTCNRGFGKKLPGKGKPKLKVK